MIDPIREANIGQPGIDADDQGDPIGKHPRQIDPTELRAAGHLPMPVLVVGAGRRCRGAPSSKAPQVISLLREIALRRATP